MPSEPVDLTVRPAGRDDLPALAELNLRARAAAYPQMPHGVHPPDEVREWVAAWDLSEQEVWVAQAPDGSPVGYARVHHDWLDDLYVDPHHQRAGVGSLLLDLVKSVRPDGFGLWVFESNTDARAFYDRHGLVTVRRTDGATNEEREPDRELAWLGADPVAALRRRVDAADDELADLLERRAGLTALVQRHKPVPGHAGRDAEREREIVARMAARAPSLGADRLARVMHALISESLDAAEQRPAP